MDRTDPCVVTGQLIQEARDTTILICRLARLAFRQPDPPPPIIPDGPRIPVAAGETALIKAGGIWRYGVVMDADDHGRVVVGYVTITALNAAQRTWTARSEEILHDRYPERCAMRYAGTVADDAGSRRAAGQEFARAYCEQVAARDCSHMPWAAVVPIQTHGHMPADVYRAESLNQPGAIPVCPALTKRVPTLLEHQFRATLPRWMPPWERAALRLLLDFDDGALFEEADLVGLFVEQSTGRPVVDFPRLAASLTEAVSGTYGATVYGVLKFAAELTTRGSHALGTLIRDAAPCSGVLIAAWREALGLPYPGKPHRG